MNKFNTNKRNGFFCLQKLLCCIAIFITLGSGAVSAQTTGCDTQFQLAHWDLENCGSSFISFNEFTASTSASPYFTSINASTLSNGTGSHSCAAGANGTEIGICSGTREDCSWEDDSDEAFTFSLTVAPLNNETTRLTSLSFYELAPTTWLTISGNSGNNDPPANYGLRVLKNGQEIFQSIGHATTTNWTLENFDFTNDPDFVFSSSTNFKFELLGYCRQGTDGTAVAWDLDEIKIFGCSENNSCANDGGDADGDGVCANEDCDDNNPNVPTTPGLACNDNDVTTTNDIIQADGCTCAGGTVTPVSCSEENLLTYASSDCITSNSAGGAPGLPLLSNASCITNVSKLNSSWNWCGYNYMEVKLNQGAYAQSSFTTVNNIFLNKLSYQVGIGISDAGCNSCPTFNYDVRVVVNDEIIQTESVSIPLQNGQATLTQYITFSTPLFIATNQDVKIQIGQNPQNCQSGCSKLSIRGLIVKGCCDIGQCALSGGDNDEDGFCGDEDCDDTNSSIPAAPGTACNDNDANTLNDVIQADGCTCAGALPTNSSLGDYVFFDLDEDGVQDGNEVGVNNVTVKLLDAAGAILETTTTNASGFYQFNGLTAGTYKVMVNAPTGYSISPQNQGSNDAIDSDINSNGMTDLIVLELDEDDPTIDAGIFLTPIGSIGNLVWNDTDGDGFKDANENGIPNVTVKLQNAAGTTLETTTTDANGLYSFTDLAAGQYKVMFNTPANFTPSPQTGNSTSNIDNNSDNNTATSMTDIFTLDSWENNLTIDAGFVPDATDLGSIGNLVWNDTDGDGFKDANENGIPNVTVKLQNAAGTTLETTTTDANGLYSFTDLPAGQYKVMFNTPANFTPSPQTGNSTSGIDNNSDNSTTTSMTNVFTLNQGENDPTIDAGFVPDVTNPCDNLTSGGQIGFGNPCSSSYEICATSGNAATIQTCQSPIGGAGTLEIIWLKNEVDCTPPTVTVATIVANPNSSNWQIINGATNLSYEPGNVSTSTCYLRCARREGCVEYLGESNIVQILVDPNCGGTPDCSDISITTGSGSITVSGLDGAPISSLQVFTSNWQQEFSCFADCGATETVNVAAGTYYVYAKYYTANYGFICQQVQTITVTIEGNPCDGQGGDSDNDGICNDVDNCPNNANADQADNDNDGTGNVCDSTPNGETTCYNVTSGGQIGSNQTVCTGDAAATITNIQSPTGGSGALEYIWLSSTTSCPTSLSQAIAGATGATYSPGALTQTTYFVRCARRANCTSWNPGESNCVTITIDNDCGGTPDCSDISITTGTGSITISGLDGAPISSLQIFNSSWQQEFSCFADCNATETVTLPAGSYQVYAKYYTAAYALICQEYQVITTSGSGCTDSDNDGVCVDEDCDDSDASVPATVGSSCNDGNPNTSNDVIQTDGCTCAGTPDNDPCANAGGDADNDGVCAASDCDDNDASVPATVGSSCNDGDSNTTGDVIQADGCTCAGTPSGGGTPDCADISISTDDGTIVVSGLANAPVTSVQIFNTQWQQEFSCFADCSATETVSVSPGTYQVYVKYYTAAYALICQEVQTVTVTNGGGGTGGCNNLTYGGEIGFDTHCDPSSDYCPGNGSVQQIKSCDYPNGGTGTIEYVWLKSTVTSTPPTSTTNDPNWAIIGGANLSAYQPNSVNQTTYFIRCARRAGCLNYIGESNVVTVLVTPGCDNGGGGTSPNCSDVTISADGGEIIATGLDGAPITSVQIMNASWQTEFTCFADCDSPIQTVAVPDGTYYVYVTYYSAAYVQICKVEETLHIVNGLASIANDHEVEQGLDFQINKWEEHTEAIWAHEEGHLVETYTLEHSADGVNFETISVIESKATQFNEVYTGYDFVPMIGDNYYRVKMDYVDGIVGYSAIEMAHFTDMIDFSLFPNPADRFVKVNLESIVGQAADIHIYNHLGQRLKEIHLEEVVNKYYQMDLQDLKEGHYVVWLNVSGRRAVAKQLVIGRL